MPIEVPSQWIIFRQVEGIDEKTVVSVEGKMAGNSNGGVTHQTHLVQ